MVWGASPVPSAIETTPFGPTSTAPSFGTHPVFPSSLVPKGRGEGTGRC